MHMRFALLLALLSFGTISLAQQYRWVDDQGKPHYSDTPPAKAKAVTKAETKASRPADAPPPYAVQRAMTNFPVTLYTAPSCTETCDKTRAILNKRGIPFTEVAVASPESREQVKALTGAVAVPVLVVGRNVFNGYEPVGIQALLDTAGYPPEGAVPARSQQAPVVPAPAGAASPAAAEAAKSPEPASVKPGPYDTSGLKSNRVDKPGRYTVPGATN